MSINWKGIVLKKAVIWLKRHSTPLLLKEAGWRLICFVAQCGSSNPLSFALRPLAGHKKLTRWLGVTLAVTVAGMALGTPVTAPVGDDVGGVWEVATVGEGSISLVTKEAIVDPLPRLEVSQRYWALHPAVDLRSPAGTPVRPVMAGQVQAVESERWGYGKHVIVEHDNGFVSLYAHLSEMNVETGQLIGVEDVIGKVGSTGRSSGPHLHLEVVENGRKVNPAQFLGFK